MPCPYLPGQTERKVVTTLSGSDVDGLHNSLSLAGFRRSHNIAYTPACLGCSACIPVRINATDFVMTRSFRRTRDMNTSLRGTLEKPEATVEQYHLFSRYENDRHSDSDMALMGFFEYRAMIEDSPIETSLAMFRDPEGQLVAACLVDHLNDGFSAVYSFFDTTLPAQRSLGTWIVLWLVEECQRQNLPYVYLGYWVNGSRKMDYKRRFRPLEALGPDGWAPLTIPDP